jgi:hypothetical protein
VCVCVCVCVCVVCASLTINSVCDKCFEDRQLTTSDEIAAVAAEANAEAEVEGDPRMRPHSIPSWTYAMKPFADKGKHVGIGRLYVKVIRAQNLPSMVGALP